MAAIAGIVNLDGKPVDSHFLDAQGAKLGHRGSGESSLHTDGPVGFVYRDPGLVPPANPGGRPVPDRSGRYLMIACGSIFNSLELADEMTGRIDRARELSNHEIMVNAYALWGASALTKMNGSFAIAIWDRQTKQLVLARDQLGLRQLFYGRFSDTIVFGSEAKAILCYPAMQSSPDEIGVANFLSVNRYLFQTRHTFYKGVSRLLPAEIRVEGKGTAHSSIYWSPRLGQNSGGMSDADLVDHVRDLMVDSVRIRSENLNTGAALSGGFDSSSIVCMLSHCRAEGAENSEPFHTFSFDFHSEDADELELIKAVSSSAGTTHHHITALTPALLHDLDKLIEVHDGPVVESSPLLLWAKKRRAQQEGVKVLLSGLGGDEVFMGTLHYLSDLLTSGRLPSFLKAFHSAYPIDLSSGSATSFEMVVKAYVLSPLIPKWLRSRRKRSSGQKFPPAWIQPSLAERAGFDRLPGSDVRADSAFEQEQYDLFKFELLGGAIPYHEETSAAHSIDTRFPLLDMRLVDLLFDVERRWKLDGPDIRRLQRSAMKSFLPKAVNEDHLKKNFHHALNRYLRELFAKPYRELIADPNLRAAEYLDMTVVSAACEDYVEGRHNDPTPVWLALNLERWLQTL